MSDYVRLSGPRITRQLAGLSVLAQLVYFRVRTGNHRTLLPGLWPARLEALAADFGLKPRELQRALAELESRRLVLFDRVAGVMFVPGVVHDDKPANPKVVTAYEKPLGRLPDCELTRSALREIEEHLRGIEWFAKGGFCLTLDGVRRGPPQNGTPNGSTYRIGNGIPESENQLRDTPGSEFRIPSSEIRVPQPDPQPQPDPARVARATQRRPLSLEQALELPIRERAEAALANEHEASYLQPQRWPEVVSVAEAFGKAQNQPVRLGSTFRDVGLRAIVERFAEGFAVEELLAAINEVPSDPWFSDGRRGLSSLTAEVVRRLLKASAQRHAKRPKVQRTEDAGSGNWVPGPPLRSLLPAADAGVATTPESGPRSPSAPSPEIDAGGNDGR